VPRLISSSSGMSSTSSGRFLRRASRHLSAMLCSLPMHSCLCWSQHPRLSMCATRLNPNPVSRNLKP
jgi:hypothetical protein